MLNALFPHPASPPRGVHAVEAAVAHSADGLTLDYRIKATPGRLVWPAASAGGRRDGLWASTCLEAFFPDPIGEGYREFNFAPDGAWAAYAFDGYRAGMREAAINPPLIAAGQIADGYWLRATTAWAPAAGVACGLCAVIEEADGVKSYWSLAHPAGKPDFHHAGGFALRL